MPRFEGERYQVTFDSWDKKVVADRSRGPVVRKGGPAEVLAEFGFTDPDFLRVAEEVCEILVETDFGWFIETLPWNEQFRTLAKWEYGFANVALRIPPEGRSSLRIEILFTDGVDATFFPQEDVEPAGLIIIDHHELDRHIIEGRMFADCRPYIRNLGNIDHGFFVELSVPDAR